MGLIASNGKVIASNGKGLTFNSLIAQANEVTGKNDKTLSAAIQSLIDGYGSGGDTMYTITETAETTVTLEANNTTVITGQPTTVSATLPEPTEGEDYLTGLIFEAGSAMTFADAAPTGYAVKWDSDPTWTAGKVYEIIYRCLWVEDSNTDVIISAKWSEV